MKPPQTKNKALELYVRSVSVEQICKRLKLSKTTFYQWQRSGKWDVLKKEAIQKMAENTTNELINVQTQLGKLASEQLLEKMKEKQLKNPELVTLAKHGLEVVRPKQTTNNLNITKNENQIETLKIIIEEKQPDAPKEKSD